MINTGTLKYRALLALRSRQRSTVVSLAPALVASRKMTGNALHQLCVDGCVRSAGFDHGHAVYEFLRMPAEEVAAERAANLTPPMYRPSNPVAPRCDPFANSRLCERAPFTQANVRGTRGSG